MRYHYSLADISEVHLEPAHHNMVNVLHVLVEEDYRRLGLGSALMAAVCRDADREGLELWLVPQPMDGTLEELERFYERLGFSWLGIRGSGYMRRVPVVLSSDERQEVTY